MIRVEAGVSVSYEELFRNEEKYDTDGEENGKRTELAENEEWKDGSDIIEKKFQILLE